VVKSKKYVVPLAILNPEVAAGFVVAYLTDGRFKAPKDAAVEVIPGEPTTLTGAPSAVGAEDVRRPLPAPAVTPASASPQ
jgi:hypothetical protein